MKKEYEALEIEIKNFATVDIMEPSNIEDGGFDDGSNDRV